MPPNRKVRWGDRRVWADEIEEHKTDGLPDVWIYQEKILTSGNELRNEPLIGVQKSKQFKDHRNY